VKTLNYEDESQECFLEFQRSRPGYVYRLDEVGIYINSLSKTEDYIDNLAFYGQDDSGSWNELFSYDTSIHKGWNKKQFDSEEDSHYVNVRFEGSTKGACAFGEISIKGIEVLDQEENISTTSCTPTIRIGGQSLETESEVNYSADSTHELLAVSRRVISVLGGEELTFTLETSGQRRMLDDAVETASVFIDDRECEVTSATETTIICVTSDKPFVEGDEPSLEITIDTSGKVATNGKVLLYAQKWSDV
jgi:hypothetical protein